MRWIYHLIHQQNYLMTFNAIRDISNVINRTTNPKNPTDYERYNVSGYIINHLIYHPIK